MQQKKNIYIFGLVRDSRTIEYVIPILVQKGSGSFSMNSENFSITDMGLDFFGLV